MRVAQNLEPPLQVPEKEAHHELKRPNHSSIGRLYFTVFLSILNKNHTLTRVGWILRVRQNEVCFLPLPRVSPCGATSFHPSSSWHQPLTEPSGRYLRTRLFRSTFTSFHTATPAHKAGVVDFASATA